ncbi:ribulokinase [Pelagicoccus sp. SDUM812003]|uniref:ribulokinase n=1 Tax=Pelagicoccus sp. SDUM812003 TaxID=3041267 RepID=UPI00280F0FBF|nr:ribulokinase [Pelagicoccus sp. SDUM812003]MDQ8205493.1 ribulokinase [Pelagicoccus sp. SDUM812003]
MAYTIGIDYGSNSVRSIVVRCSDGTEIATSVFNYPSGELGILLDSDDHHLARQHPGDYVAGLETSVRDALADAAKNDESFSSEKVIGLGVDTTGSSPIPVDSNNIALATQDAWKGNLAAECWLWKDHTSVKEAQKITELGREHRPQFLAKCGNTYSSEWFWAKIWHCLNIAPEVFEAAYSWVELCDWVPSLLAGVKDPKAVKRGICAAGHKALYSDDWNGLPDKEFLSMLNPKLADLRDRLYEKAYDASEKAGDLCEEWATRLGLPAGIPIAIGEFDVHYGAIGAGVEEGVLVKVLGTSTCDCAVVSGEKDVADIPGICGIVPGAILPGFYGIEAGQSAVGDIFAWFVNRVLGDDSKHGELTKKADELAPGESGLLALDWNNGNRTILVDPLLSGLLLGQTLHTTQSEIYRALIEATAFGARMILERIEEYGVPVSKVVCAGGIAEKNPMLMQIYADITGRDMLISRSSQTCALGSAISAAVQAGSAAGGYDDFKTAQEKMSGLKDVCFKPEPKSQAVYEKLFALYKKLHDAFGGVSTESLAPVMKELLEIKEAARSKKA